MMDLDFNGVGNHEFDEGITELLRMQYGNRPGFGYVPADPAAATPLTAAATVTTTRAPSSSSSRRTSSTRQISRHRFGIRRSSRRTRSTFTKGGAKIAFVGMTLEGTDLIVSPGGISSIDFLDEAESVNALVPQLKDQGVEAIVVLLHEGGRSVPTLAARTRRRPRPDQHLR